jgi:hypothetical protein
MLGHWVAAVEELQRSRAVSDHMEQEEVKKIMLFCSRSWNVLAPISSCLSIAKNIIMIEFIIYQ